MALTITPIKLCPVAVLTNVPVQVYLTPMVTGVVVKKATVTNITGSPAGFNIWVVLASGAATNGNLLCAGVSVAGNATYIVNELNGLVLGPGDTLWAQASALTTLNFNASGFAF